MHAYVSHLGRLRPALRLCTASRVSLLAVLPMAMGASMLQAQTANVMPDPRATALIAELGLKQDPVAALSSGRLGGAGLDVTDPEPLTDGHPLWSMHNVIITPHVAAQSGVQSERYVLLAAENLRRYAAGEALLNVVDIQRGY